MPCDCTQGSNAPTSLDIMWQTVKYTYQKSAAGSSSSGASSSVVQDVPVGTTAPHTKDGGMDWRLGFFSAVFWAIGLICGVIGARVLAPRQGGSVRMALRRENPAVKATTPDPLVGTRPPSLQFLGMTRTRTSPRETSETSPDHDEEAASAPAADGV